MSGPVRLTGPSLPLSDTECMHEQCFANRSGHASGCQKAGRALDLQGVLVIMPQLLSLEALALGKLGVCAEQPHATIS